MPVSPYLLCLWPGLPALWLRGDWRGLAAAVVFSALFNVLLVSSWIWPEWIDGGWHSILWWTVVIWWLCAWGVSMWGLGQEVEPAPTPDAGALFREAQAEYLLGHWFETEGILLQLLETSPTDAEARLLLATVYRRRGRIDDARQSLVHLERLDAAAAWSYEIDAEKRFIEASEADVAKTDSPGTDDPPESAEDNGAASVPLANEGKKGVSVDDPSQQRRAA